MGWTDGRGVFVSAGGVPHNVDRSVTINQSSNAPFILFIDPFTYAHTHAHTYIFPHPHDQPTTDRTCAWRATRSWWSGR
jgi:hypothetical protein